MENFPGKARSNGESFPDVVDPGHEEKGKGDDVVLAGGAPKSDNALRALWIDGSVCLLLLSGDFVSGEVLSWGNTVEGRRVESLNEGSRSLGGNSSLISISGLGCNGTGAGFICGGFFSASLHDAEPEGALSSGNDAFGAGSSLNAFDRFGSLGSKSGGCICFLRFPGNGSNGEVLADAAISGWYGARNSISTRSPSRVEF
jgi:hypothetical protein